MAEERVKEILKKVYETTESARVLLQPNELNEEWTKDNLIRPVLEALEWDWAFEVRPESRGEGTEGSLDYMLKPKEPGLPTMGLEAKALRVSAPERREHDQITKGLKQSKERGARHFIWTNGDTWLVLSLALSQAPMFEISLSKTGGNEEAIEELADRFRIIGRNGLDAEAIDQQIQENWKVTALPQCLKKLLSTMKGEFLELARKALPAELMVDDQTIIDYFDGLNAQVSSATRERRPPSHRILDAGPEDWEKLVTSDEPQYEKARVVLLRQERSKLGEYLVGDSYKPWSKALTFKLLGYPRRGTDTKGKTSQAIRPYKKWNFIREAASQDRRVKGEVYERVEESVPFLKRLLDRDPPNPPARTP
jgi:hypothetical protein